MLTEMAYDSNCKTCPAFSRCMRVLLLSAIKGALLIGFSLMHSTKIDWLSNHSELKMRDTSTSVRHMISDSYDNIKCY